MEEVLWKAGSHRQGLGVSSAQAGAGLSRVQVGGCSAGHKPKVSRILAGSGLDLGSFSRSGASWSKGGGDPERSRGWPDVPQGSRASTKEQDYS